MVCKEKHEITLKQRSITVQTILDQLKKEGKVFKHNEFNEIASWSLSPEPKKVTDSLPQIFTSLNKLAHTDIMTTPVVSTVRLREQEIVDIIEVEILVYINTDSTTLTHEDFVPVYNFSLDSLGVPQLDIYISFEFVEPVEAFPVYTAYNFKMALQHLKEHEEYQPVNLSKIEKVKVVLYNFDPDTSRGTETTIQGG